MSDAIKVVLRAYCVAPVRWRVGDAGRVVNHHLKGSSAGVKRGQVEIAATLIDDHAVLSRVRLETLPERGTADGVLLTDTERRVLLVQPSCAIARDRMVWLRSKT